MLDALSSKTRPRTNNKKKGPSTRTMMHESPHHCELLAQLNLALALAVAVLTGISVGAISVAYFLTADRAASRAASGERDRRLAGGDATLTLHASGGRSDDAGPAHAQRAAHTHKHSAAVASDAPSTRADDAGDPDALIDPAELVHLAGWDSAITNAEDIAFARARCDVVPGAHLLPAFEEAVLDVEADRLYASTDETEDGGGVHEVRTLDSYSSADGFAADFRGWSDKDIILALRRKNRKLTRDLDDLDAVITAQESEIEFLWEEPALLRAKLEDAERMLGQFVTLYPNELFPPTNVVVSAINANPESTQPQSDQRETAGEAGRLEEVALAAVLPRARARRRAAAAAAEHIARMRRRAAAATPVASPAPTLQRGSRHV